MIAVAPPGPLGAQAVSPAPLRQGEVVAQIKATKVNDFDVRAPVSRAEFTGTDATNVTAVVEVRVADMRSGIGLRDTHLRNAMRADSFPTIRFELVGAIPGERSGDTLAVTFQGHLTIHGVTKTIRAPGTVVLRAGGTDITAEFPVDMREYGVNPPSRFLGAIRVQPLTQVSVVLRFGEVQ